MWAQPFYHDIYCTSRHTFVLSCCWNRVCPVTIGSGLYSVLFYSCLSYGLEPKVVQQVAVPKIKATCCKKRIWEMVSGRYSEDTQSNRLIYPLNDERQCTTETCSFLFSGIEPPNSIHNFLVDHLHHPRPPPYSIYISASVPTLLKHLNRLPTFLSFIHIDR
jgi:hypothetical protein